MMSHGNSQGQGHGQGHHQDPDPTPEPTPEPEPCQRARMTGPGHYVAADRALMLQREFQDGALVHAVLAMASAIALLAKVEYYADTPSVSMQSEIDAWENAGTW